MFKEKYEKYIRWGITIFLIVLASFLCFFAMLRFDGFKRDFNYVLSVLKPVTVGLVIAYVLLPLADWFERLICKIARRAPDKRPRGARGLAITFSVLVLLAIITLLIFTIIPQLVESVTLLIQNLDGYINSIVEWATPYLDVNPAVMASIRRAIEETEANIKSFLQDDLMKLLGSVTAGVMEVGKYIYNFVIGIIVSIYMLAARDNLIGGAKKLIYAFLKPARGNQVLGVVHEADRLFKGYITGQLMGSTILGVICFIGMSIMRMPYTLFISVIVGVTNLIPYFGPFIGAIPSALLILMIDPMQCLAFVIFILILQQVEGNVIGPKVLGNTTGLSSFGVLFSILLGGGLFGLAGMILAVPTFGVLYALFKRMMDRRLKKRNLPLETDQYVEMEGIVPDTHIPGYAPGHTPRRRE